MGKRFDLIVFDWDGTILDSTGAIVRSIKAACRDLCLPEPADAMARQVIGLGLADALRIAVPDLPEDSVSEIIARYRYHYLSCDQDLCLFEGVPSLMGELHAGGYSLAVATGKSRRGLERAFEHSGLGSFFHASRCADECFSKPHPQMLMELMEELEVEPDRTVMIGDTVHDLQMARNAGVSALAVSYGAHPKESLLSIEPDACFADVAEMLGWLRLNA